MSGGFPEETVHGDGVTLTPEHWSPGHVAFAVTWRSGVDTVGHLEVRDLGGGVAAVDWRLDPAGERCGAAALTTATDWACTNGARRVETLLEVEDVSGQRVAMSAGYVREGLRRGMPVGLGGSRDLVPFARLAGDPHQPAPRELPDLPGGELTDGVVTVRPLTAADAEDSYRLRTTPDVADTWLPPVPPTAAEVRAWCGEAPASWLAGTVARCTVRDAATAEYAGEISVDYQAPPLRQAMLGYGLLPAYRGKGYASRAVALVTRWVFGHTGIERLVAGTLVHNVASQRVLERAGFVREGEQRGLLPGAGGRRDNVGFALLRDDHVRGQDTSS